MASSRLLITYSIILSARTSIPQIHQFPPAATFCAHDIISMYARMNSAASGATIALP